MRTIPESSQSFIELKAITDSVYAGDKSEFAVPVLALLDKYGIRVHQGNARSNAVNISIPRSLKNAIVVGIRYQMQDGTHAEDHFLFQKDQNLKEFTSGTLHQELPEYSLIPRGQLNEESEVVSPEKVAWTYMNYDLAKLKVLADSYLRLVGSINVADGQYNQFFQLMLDAFSARLISGIYRFFDKRSDSWSLCAIGVKDEIWQPIKRRAAKLVELRHNEVAHMGKGYETQPNFLLLTTSGVGLAIKIISDIHQVLSDIGRDQYSGHSFALTWIGIDDSLRLMIEKLGDGDFV